MKEAINNQLVPDFGVNEPPMKFEEGEQGWKAMLSLINSRRQQKIFWDFIDKLNNIRVLYNCILRQKFRQLKVSYRRNGDIQKLFNESYVEITSRVPESPENEDQHFTKGKEKKKRASASQDPERRHLDKILQ